MLGSLVALVTLLPATVQTKPVAVIPFRIGEDAMIVDAVVNGRKASFMFDTGFSGAFVLNESLNIGTPTGETVLRDFVGEFRARNVKLKSLSLGGFSIPAGEMEVVQQPLAHMSESYNTHTDGIMGLEPIANYVVEIDFQAKEMRLHPTTFDISTRKPDNQRTFLQRMLPIGHNSVILQVETPSSKRMTLALDTGNAFYATTHKEVLEEVGLWPKGQAVKYMRTAMVGSGPVDSFYFRMPALKVFGVPVEESVWSIIDLPSSSSEHDGTVGFGFLRHFHVIFDFQRRRVWLERQSDFVGSRPVADVGISAGYDPIQKRAIIFRVTPDSPAALAGIKAGDSLLGVDGEEIKDVGFRRLQQRMEGELGSTIRVATSRNGILMRHELTRKMLVNGMPESPAKSPASDPAKP